MNGDGYGDLAIGAPDGALHISGGGGLVVALRQAPGRAHHAQRPLGQGLSVLVPRRFPGQGTVEQHVGDSVALVGDVTGDGWPDIAVGAPQADFNGRANSGSVWIVSGHLPPIDAGCTGMLVDNSCPWIRLWQQDANQAYRIDGAQAGDGLGSSIAGVGDQNGDGITDIAIGESGASPVGRAGAGEVVVVPGTAPLAMRDLATSPPLQRIYGASAGAGLGASLAAAGDVDGDGHGDMLIGAPGESSSAGAAYLVRGVAGATSDLANPSAAIAPAGAGGQAGSSVAAGQSLDGGDVDSLVASRRHGGAAPSSSAAPARRSCRARTRRRRRRRPRRPCRPRLRRPRRRRRPRRPRRSRRSSRRRSCRSARSRSRSRSTTRQRQAREGEAQALPPADAQGEGRAARPRQAKATRPRPRPSSSARPRAA